MKWLLHRLHGRDERYAESEDLQELHEMIGDASGDESRESPHPQIGLSSNPPASTMGCRGLQVLRLLLPGMPAM